MALFALSSLLYTVVTTPLLLLPIRMLSSLGLAGVFMVGAAYIGDHTTPAERGIAFGLYSTAMALGFTIGPAVGGWVAEQVGYNASYRVAAVIALVGVFIAQRGLLSTRPPQSGAPPTQQATAPMTLAQKLQRMVQHAPMVAASLANLGNNLIFTTVFSFVPLYAATLGIGEATLGAIFALRGLASAAARIPGGLLSARIASRLLMVVGLGLAALVMFTLNQSRTATGLTLLLIVDGIAYGLFLTVGQSHVTALAGDGDRGRVMGIYTMAGSIGSAAGPILMGVLAEWFGLPAVFPLAAVVAAVAALILWRSGHWQPQSPGAQPAPAKL
jgi:MFS family permease